MNDPILSMSLKNDFFPLALNFQFIYRLWRKKGRQKIFFPRQWNIKKSSNYSWLS
jgi:hypothetical protein